nr:hypothetical protein [uncultured Brevundimonas sp.]
MISKLLTGGIDLPELRSKVSKLELLLDYKIEETNKALADHIAKENESLSAHTAALAIRCNGLKADNPSSGRWQPRPRRRCRDASPET